MAQIPRLPSSEITPESAWLDRRRFLAAAGVAGAGLLGAGGGEIGRAHV